MVSAGHGARPDVVPRNISKGADEVCIGPIDPGHAIVSGTEGIAM